MSQEQQLKIRSLKTSFIEGWFACLMTGFTQDYFTPFLLILGGTAGQVGLMSAGVNFFSSIIQLKSAEIVDWFSSRKKMINVFIFLQALMLLPMSAMAIFEIKQPRLFIILVTLFTCSSALAVPAWLSMMSDLVSWQKRGEFFGRRNKILGFVTVAGMFIAGLLLYLMKRINIFAGFALLFFVAFIWRLFSRYFMEKMYDPPIKSTPESSFTFYQFLRRLKYSNFAQFVIAMAGMNFAVNLAAPFFAVFMIRDLKLNYFLYAVIVLTATLTINAMISRWGRHADKIGNLKIIKFTTFFIAFTPLLWVISYQPVWLIFAQIFSGFMWSGFSLCSANFIFDSVTPPKRTRCVAYFNVLNGTALCLGAIIGGILLPVLPNLNGYNALVLFSISAVIRLVVALFFVCKLKEVRPVEPIKSSRLFFSMLGVNPVID